jgi:hypothetical protein
MPVDDEEDLELPIWSGLIPLQTNRLEPIADDYSKNIPVPAHLNGILNFIFLIEGWCITRQSLRKGDGG